MKKTTFLAVSTFSIFTSFAQVSLQVTEIWPGNIVKPNLTSDWFEITNEGDTAWSSESGNIYFVDDRDEADYAEDAVIIEGITGIAPGESVIVVNDKDTIEFTEVWGGVYDLSKTQIGIHDGKGLGGGGDTVNIFISSTTPTDNSTRVDSEAYPDTASNPGQSYDVNKGGFSIIGESPNKPVATAVNDGNESAVGSPGNNGDSLNISNITSNNLSIYPLPFSNELNIRLSNQNTLTTVATITDMLGSVVYKENISFLNGESSLNSLSNLQSGIYILHIPKLNITMKIIK